MNFSQTSRYPILIKLGILKYRSGDDTILGKKTEIGGGLGEQRGCMNFSQTCRYSILIKFGILI